MLEETRQISLNELKKMENESALLNANLNLLIKQKSTLIKRIDNLKKDYRKKLRTLNNISPKDIK